jgi:8-oxo-dGTP pyrophosphatase MutT (NUDIX family)
MPFLQNIHPFKISELDDFIQVFVGDKQIGRTPRDFANKISAFNDVWSVTDRGMVLNPALDTFDARTTAIDDTFKALSAAGILPSAPDYTAFGGIDWINAYPHDGSAPLFIIQRFYYSCLGLQAHAVIVNGYSGNNYWAAIRSMNVETGAGKLDVIVAGMIRHQETMMEAMAHEAEEEAGLTKDDIKGVKEVSTLHLPNLNKYGFFQDEWLHVFDIDLKDKAPIVGMPIEVDGFKLLTIEQLMKDIQAGTVFKEHIHLVITDFLIRHGHLNESHPEFEAIKKLLYQENYALANRP